MHCKVNEKSETRKVKQKKSTLTDIITGSSLFLIIKIQVSSQTPTTAYPQAFTYHSLKKVVLTRIVQISLYSNVEYMLQPKRM